MQRRVKLFLLAALSVGFSAAALFAADPPVPKIDKPKLDAYLRYIEGYTSGVKIVIDDPTPSAYPGFSRVLVHLSMDTRTIGDRLYYVSADGEHFFSGLLWDSNDNPFLDTIEHLPSTGPSFGPADAKVTIVVFSDFQCPYCREFASTIRQNIPKKYPNDVRVVFENFPIVSLHPWAESAAEAGRCLSDESAAAFWAFHDWIFDHQGEVNDQYEHQKAGFAAYLRNKAVEIAKPQKLDTTKLASCIDTHATAKAIAATESAGWALQIQQTPTSFINGRMIPGAQPWTNLDAIIQLELNRPKDIPGPSEKCCEVTAPTVFKRSP